jgi:GT2 family glycosyltransferase/glycosyltransferase involved in cell wall biosynthesis
MPLPGPASVATSKNGYAAEPTDIVVCVHDALDDVRLCLDSVVARGDDRPFHLILVDDGSQAECAAYLRDFSARHPNVELIRHDEARGYTRAANVGLRRTTAGSVVLLNSDTIVTPGWLAGLRECLQSAPEIGIVGPLSNAASYQSIPVVRSPSGDWSLNPVPASWSVDQIAALVRQVSPRQFPRLPFLNGFCLMLSRRVIDAVGLLDEEAFPVGFGEENDYCLRARDAGFALAVADHVYVFHAKSRSFGNARRADLSAFARGTLEHKHGGEQIRGDIDSIEANIGLRRLRENVGDAFRHTSPPPAPPAPDRLSVLFLLPVSGGGGGAHSVVQEALGMRPLGVRSHVAVKAEQAALHAANYPSAWGRGLFLPFDTNDHLVRMAGGFDVVVATIYTSMHRLQAIAEAHPDVLPAYYVQDYEPWFCREGTHARQAALATYTAIPNMLLFAKTDWLCGLVQERHGIPVHKVQPGLDPDVYFPGDRLHVTDSPVHVAAMIRPTTPRRAAHLTMDVLEESARRYGEAVRLHIFGSNDAVVAHHGLTPDFPVVNHGKLRLEQVADLLRSVDVFLDLSEYQAFGRTGLEAMACGCVTVLPAFGGTGEYAVDRQNALVVDTADFEACVAAASEVIEDAELRSRLQRAGYATGERYSISQAALSEVSVLRESLRAWRRTHPSPSEPNAFFQGARMPVAIEHRS